MFHWSSIFLVAFGAIAFLPISSANPEICSSDYACNAVRIARMCQIEEWCKKQAAACDTIPIFQEASDFYFLDILVNIWDMCRYRYLAYKKFGIEPAEILVDNSDHS